MRFGLILLLLLFGRSAAAQESGTAAAAGATVSGVVHDSISKSTLAGASVQLAGTGSLASFLGTAISDAAGRFTIRDVPSGRFMLGFFHPMLDSLGLEPPLREVHVEGVRPVRADLAIPSAERLRYTICKPQTRADSGAIVVGIVRDAERGTPIAGASVVGEWLELSLNRAGYTRRVARIVGTTAENGWFALCDVPRPGTLEVVATDGTDSTDFIEVEVGVDGFQRRDLYLGSARTIVIGAAATAADTLAVPPRRVHAGEGRLRGTVITAVGEKPVPGAIVRITNGPETRANDRGEWTLVDVPFGTRMLEVRAVGYYPDRAAVHVVQGATPVRTALPTMAAMLATVRIQASRLNSRNVGGFAERRHMGIGKYLTRDDIARRQPIVLSDLLRMVPGVRVEPASMGGTLVTMRGMFAGRCAPAVYLDGHHMRGFGADDIDDLASPDEVAGIEIYTPGTVPPQFEPGMSGCGSIVIWTQQRTGSAGGRPFKQRLFAMFGAVAVGLMVGATIR
ncbi:MAG: carboxypeptidase regulatory-like domain-containing protein [Gemmatimonadaceae bacterium]